MQTFSLRFTLWPGLTQTTGAYAEITWETFVSFVSTPAVAAEKTALEGWSPAKFANNSRAQGSHVERISCVILDDDSSALPLDRVQAIWAGLAGIVHTTHSHSADAPKYRIVLRCSRDMLPAEYERLWQYLCDNAAARGQTLDRNTRNASRFWYVPGHREGSPYAWRELVGAPLDVDAILAAVPAEPTAIAPAERVSSDCPDRRHAMAAALGTSWPAKGRHEAQLALAGALRAEGWEADEALEFLCAVCRTAGDEDRSKREATVRHTWGRGAGAPLTGWTRLKTHIDPVLVDAVRSGLARGAEWTERTERLLERHQPATATVATVATDSWGLFDWNVIDPPIAWRIAGVLQEATVNLAFGPPNSLKTWSVYLMAGAVARGEPWLGRAVRQGTVIILDYESSPRQARRRMKLLRLQDLTNVRYINPAEMLDDPKLWERLALLKPALVIVDSLSRGMLGRSENDADVMNVPLDYAKRLARDCETATVMIHHKNKGAREGHDSARGSGAIVAAAEGWLEFLDFEALEGGIQRVRLHCARLKESVPFDDICLELSDERGLIEVARKIEPVEEKTPDKNRALVLAILKQRANGVPKKMLTDMMKGKNEAKFALLAELALSNITVESHSQESGRKALWVMLKPGIAL